MNEDEVFIISEQLGIEAEVPAFSNRFSRRQYILITKRKQGLVCYIRKESYQVVPIDIPVVDTVGAGESLSAGFLSFLCKEKSMQIAFEKAFVLANYVVGQRGATPSYSDELKNLLLGSGASNP